MKFMKDFLLLFSLCLAIFVYKIMIAAIECLKPYLFVKELHLIAIAIGLVLYIAYITFKIFVKLGSDN